MSSLDEKIARAQEAQQSQRPYKDVAVSLDSALSDERESLVRQIGELSDERDQIVEAAASSLAMAPDTAKIDKRINSLSKRIERLDKIDQDSLITIRIYRADGGDWMELKAGCPPRINSAIDRGCGYNVNTLTLSACATYGRILDGEAEIEKSVEEWTPILSLLSGGEFERVADTVYKVNVSDSLRRTEALKKALEVRVASDQK